MIFFAILTGDDKEAVHYVRDNFPYNYRNAINWARDKDREFIFNSLKRKVDKNKKNNSHKNRGLSMPGDSYSGKIGIIAPGAIIETVIVNQGGPEEKEIDLYKLHNELEKLRNHLQINATTVEHFAEIGAIANAEIEAKKGNGETAFQALSKAGKWTLDIAEKIGVGLAVAALKTALGI